MTQNKSTRTELLFISPVAPDALGDLAQRRASQVLDAASKTGPVHLIVTGTKTVHLKVWRRITERAASATFLPAASGKRTTAEVQSFCEGKRFAAAIAGSPAVWGLTKLANAAMRICDCDVPQSQRYADRARNTCVAMRWYYDMKTEMAHELESRVARQSDAVLVSDRKCAFAFLTRARQTLIMPAGEYQPLVELLAAAIKPSVHITATIEDLKRPAAPATNDEVRQAA